MARATQHNTIQSKAGQCATVQALLACLGPQSCIYTYYVPRCVPQVAKIEESMSGTFVKLRHLWTAARREEVGVT